MDNESAMTLLSKARSIVFDVVPLLREGNIEKAIKSMHYGLAVYGKYGGTLMSGGRKEFEQLLDKALYMISLDKAVKKIANIALEYAPGKEAAIVKRLQIILELLKAAKCREEEERQHTRIQLKSDMMAKGTKLVQNRCFDGAIQLFHRLCAHCRTDAALHAEIGRLLYDAGHIECITFFEKAVEIEPKDHASLATMGLALRKIKRFEQAREAYLAALALDGDNLGYLFNLSRVCIDTGDWSNAQKYLRRVLEIDPDVGVARKALAFASKHCRDML